MFQKAGDSLFQKTVNRAGIAQQVAASQYVQFARDVLAERFGDGADKHAVPRSIKDRALRIEVKHPAVGEEIRRQQESIIAEMNRRIGRPEIVRIDFILPRHDPEEAY